MDREPLFLLHEPIHIRDIDLDGTVIQRWACVSTHYGSIIDYVYTIKLDNGKFANTYANNLSTKLVLQ